ncbi:hypothetical protein KC316_g62 [Hortaea werneckii]|nr:hypothetical protein KC316_g62 [Hortaea werneckii]
MSSNDCPNLARSAEVRRNAAVFGRDRRVDLSESAEKADTVSPSLSSCAFAFTFTEPQARKSDIACYACAAAATAVVVRSWDGGAEMPLMR